MTARPPNELERKLHQAALVITIKQSEALIPDTKMRENAINFLLGVGLFKMLKDNQGTVSFRAVAKNEMNATKDLGGEESLVLGHIKAAGNEGIWTKHLKGKTDLHQTVIDRCIKTLTQKQLIKAVKSVKHPTRKIYMLSHLDPSVELTGGPWYTDNELDTEFIKLLCNACLRLIQDKTFPKRRTNQPQPALYPISSPPEYPNAKNVLQFLKQSRITETPLSVEHVESLLNVLVLDGEIERIPAYGSSLWDAKAIADDPESESERHSKSKRRHRSREDRDGRKKSKSSKRQDSDSETDDASSPPRKKSRRSKREDSDSDDEPKRKRKKSKARDSDSEEDEDEDRVEKRKRKQSRSKSKKSKSRGRSEDESTTASSDPDTESDGSSRRGRARGSSSKSRSKANVSKSAKRSSSPAPFEEYDFENMGTTHVYRAIRPERAVPGWSQAPCTACPSFDFCDDRGPVNAKDCVYYGEWLSSATAVAE
ncbi:RNA polymerase Rpc34 subunit-domain-containing protein [Thelephora terrestris]|uniref:RNA polymerase Rpc34 subunit-domain-containing protein n=1 Tax=Thelephora terrestris TaxID=56493 RepID=A0A9P6L442_9AGAM|nr:RNA polymerase Rpc34 subunit-domain-containing protein [Thelephora terrestris]